ncbi:unnamed protein product [Hermetia illucens]|uniref:Uncharacterized protein n=1 Tax=Hermetia illucens TaxID=343691 RepID=A0A7R8Z111_HERIL|nr:unnamed protein product [Hermetia illucens]
MKYSKQSEDTQQVSLCFSAHGITDNGVFGYKEYGIDPLDPLSIPYVKFAQKSTGAIQVKQEFFDTLVYNFANQTKFTKLRVDLDKNMIEMELFNPLLALKGTYKTEGKILVLQVNGGGKYFLNFHDITIRYTLKFKTVKRNGKNIWQFYESEGFYNPKKLTTYAEDLVKGQKEITDQMNAVFNENWKELWQDFEPIFSRSVGKVVLNYLNKIFAHIPIDETFKP